MANLYYNGYNYNAGSEIRSTYVIVENDNYDAEDGRNGFLKKSSGTGASKRHLPASKPTFNHAGYTLNKETNSLH
jgi:hypothetical protein